MRIVGIGGSTRPGSTAERALRAVLAEAERLGARVSLLAGPDLVMPSYDPGGAPLTPAARRLVAEAARADGVVLASPAYHGGISGLVKNALDHLEELRDDPRPYLSGRAVGCLAVGQGHQGAVVTLGALRAVTHALRGWPTPLGVALDSSRTALGPAGRCEDAHVEGQLRGVAEQVVDFARMSANLTVTLHS
ncbi:NADPH-dependent FMN reductase [Streptomyces sp. NBC_00158]|uniref:NADPH-dependent FMN reductase n=1 Tax=Streptomyces sp. NBC_00158 TaxID=2903627 RepID=UPI00324E2A47